jgi:hypothetical protein
MRVSTILAVVLAALMPLAALAMMASTQAFAYDGFEGDFATCTQGNDQAAVVAACTRLIDNAATENSMVGMFYGLRAANNTDAAQNCADARKSLALADDDAIKGLSQKLIDANC